MLNVLELEKITKDDVLKRFSQIISNMNNHQFMKMKKKLNKLGVLDHVCK